MRKKTLSTGPEGQAPLRDRIQLSVPNKLVLQADGKFAIVIVALVILVISLLVIL